MRPSPRGRRPRRCRMTRARARWRGAPEEHRADCGSASQCGSIRTTKPIPCLPNRRLASMSRVQTASAPLHSPPRPVAVTVGPFPAPGAAAADREATAAIRADHRHGPHVAPAGQEIAQLVGEEGGQCGHGRTEPEGGGRQQQVLHGGKHRRRQGGLEGHRGAATDDHDHGRARRCHPRRRRGPRRGGSAGGGPRSATVRRPARPDGSGSPMAARRPSSRTTTNSQGWRFSALGAWVAASRHRSTRSSPSGSVGERAAGTLIEYHLEEPVGGGRDIITGHRASSARSFPTRGRRELGDGLRPCPGRTGPLDPSTAPARLCRSRSPVRLRCADDPIRAWDDGGVARLVLDRPEAKNALSIEMRDDIVAPGPRGPLRPRRSGRC